MLRRINIRSASRHSISFAIIATLAFGFTSAAGAQEVVDSVSLRRTCEVSALTVSQKSPQSEVEKAMLCRGDRALVAAALWDWAGEASARELSQLTHYSAGVMSDALLQKVHELALNNGSKEVRMATFSAILSVADPGLSIVLRDSTPSLSYRLLTSSHSSARPSEGMSARARALLRQLRTTSPYPDVRGAAEFYFTMVRP